MEADTPAIASLEGAGVAFDVVRTDRPSSVEESAALQGIDVGHLVRTIVVRRGADDYVFVLVPGGREVDWPKLRRHLGVKRLSLPDADEAKDATGYERGAITPFGSVRSWPVVADATVAGLDRVAIGGGARGTNLHVSVSDLLRHLKAQVADVTRPARTESLGLPPERGGKIAGMAGLRMLTWHVHGSYLSYLARIPHTIYLPVKPGRPEGYGGRGHTFDWPDTVVEVPAEEVTDLDLDVVLFQSRANYLEDQFEILSPPQRSLPRIYVEHDPPREHPTDTKHVVDDPDVLLVHVTHFNDLMWDSGRTPTRVIEHGVSVPPGLRWTGELERGIAVVNNLARRGRRVGADLFHRARAEVPLDLAGMGTEEAGGLGEVPPRELHAFQSRYRFLFHPIRYTSLGLALCEAMMLGMPVVAPATTEVATVISDGDSGFAHTDVERLIDAMRALLADRALAERIGAAGQELALERFSIDRFVAEWDATLVEIAGRRTASISAVRPR